MNSTSRVAVLLVSIAAGLASPGCLSLSFGGKHEHLGFDELASASRISELEERIATLEDRVRDCPCAVTLEPERSTQSVPLVPPAK